MLMQCICVHLYREPDTISGIIKGRLRWLGHVERMTEDKKCLRTSHKYKRSVGKPRKRWLDEDENDLNKTGVRGRKKKLGVETPRN